MSEFSELFSIVVAGHMNPAIHHPSWYRLAKLISREEQTSAESKGGIICTNVLSRFTAGTLQITCEREKWNVQTADLFQLERLAEMSAQIFDEVLKHTPVSAYGVNFQYHRENKSPDVASRLGTILAQAPLGILTSGAKGISGILQRVYEEKVINLIIEPSIHSPSSSS